MTDDDARGLLAELGFTRVCDLDLLLFFARHPRSLLASESLASFLGYELKDIADSLDVLMGAGLLTRTQTTAHAARLYAFALDDTNGEWVESFLNLAATREGRLALRDALRTRRDQGRSESNRDGKPHAMTKPGPRRLVASSRRRTGTA